MEFYDIPSIFQSRLRIALTASLISGPKDFTSLKNLTSATPGNLGKQLELMESEGYINCIKEFIKRRPRTTYSITDKGLKAFREYVELLEKVLK